MVPAAVTFLVLGPFESNGRYRRLQLAEHAQELCLILCDRASMTSFSALYIRFAPPSAK